MIESVCCFLLLLIAKVNANCELDSCDLKRTGHLFVKTTGNERSLLRTNLIQANEKFEMICGQVAPVVITCKADGEFTPPLPRRKCPNPIQATVEKVTDSICRDSMYRVGYKMNSNKFLELYRSCYNEAKIQANYVIYDSHPHTLGGDSKPEFSRDGVISGAAAVSFKNTNVYDRFEKLVGPKQSYVTSNAIAFDRGHLAPAADFGFDKYVKLTYKYINVVPQFCGINRSNVKNIEKWIQDQRKKIGEAYRVCVGGLDVLQLMDKSSNLKEIFLFEVVQINNEQTIRHDANPVPKWLFKIISNSIGPNYAFLTYNNRHDTADPTPNCKTVDCPVDLTLTKTKTSGLSFCCDQDDFIDRNVPHLKSKCSETYIFNKPKSNFIQPTVTAVPGPAKKQRTG
ncbi:uncharacterized protein LOC117790871 [Drosophila innubila]|uniref:uncharacterized protein LOC117790871 n=1 Tax=Drosophila innubila TaxID=198719 RepID=UPI00148CD766|nr:uncharacterized protein LOC117790871 [Drosophila innubila]